MKSRLTYIVLVVFLLIYLFSCNSFPPEFPAPDFFLKSPITGKTVDLESLKGKPAILYWFTSW